MAVSFGPSHQCQGGCGHSVYYRFDSRKRWPTLHEGAGLFPVRHVCPKFYMPPTVEFLECFCGKELEIVGGVRYDLKTLKLHRCNAIPVQRGFPKVAPRLPDFARGSIEL